MRAPLRIGGPVVWAILFAIGRGAEAELKAPAAKPVELKGEGARESEAFDLVEGRAVIEVRHSTESKNTYFSVWIQADPDSTGKWDASARNPVPLLVHQAGYEEAMAVERKVPWSVDWTGPTRLVVSAKGRWSFRITQEPAPRHAIEGDVTDGSGARVENAEVEVLDGEGGVATARTDGMGRFSVPVYGNRTYTVRARRNSDRSRSYLAAVPRYRPAAVRRNLVLGSAARSGTVLRDRPKQFVPVDPGDDPARPGIHGRVTFATTGTPVVREEVTLTDLRTGKTLGRHLTAGDGSYRFTSLLPGDYGVLVGPPIPPYADDGLAKSARDLRADEHRRLDFSIVPLRTVVRGTLRALDGNRTLPVPRIPVHVLYKDSGDAVKAVTDDDGRFLAVLEKPAKSCRLVAVLQDEDGIFRVSSARGFGGDVVALETRELPFRGPAMALDLMFSERAPLAWPESEDRGAVVGDGGTYYARSWKAWCLARDRLRLKLDHKMPVEIRLYEPKLAKATYWDHDSSIQVGALNGKSSAASPDGPDNREFHEFAHHVNADSAMGGENILPPRLAGEKNHDGIRNGSTRDSLAEGFAIFYALLCKGSSDYVVQGEKAAKTLLLQSNEQSYLKGPEEQLQVAALLWDLSDDDVEAGDTVSVPIETLWATIARPSVVDVRSLYEAFRSRAEKAPKPAAEIRALDALFVLHGFFCDTNRNGKRDEGEPVGWADRHVKHPGKTVDDGHRRDYDGGPESCLRVVVEDAAGCRLAPAIAVIRTVFSDGREATSETPVGPDGKLGLALSGDVDLCLVAPQIAGWDVEIFETTGADAHDAARAAHLRGDPFFHEVRLEATPNAVPMPTGAEATLRPDGSVVVSWSAPGPVVVVRGAAHLPLDPYDGEVVFSGEATEVADPVALDPADWRWSVFGQGVEGAFSTPVEAVPAGATPHVPAPTAEHPAQSVKSQSGWIAVAAAVLAAATLLLVLALRTRK